MYLPNTLWTATIVFLPCVFHQYWPISIVYDDALQPFSISTERRNILSTWYSPQVVSIVKYCFCLILRSKVVRTCNFALQWGQVQCSVVFSIVQLCPQSIHVVRPLGKRYAKWSIHSLNAHLHCVLLIGRSFLLSASTAFSNLFLGFITCSPQLVVAKYIAVLIPKVRIKKVIGIFAEVEVTQCKIG